VREVNLNYWMQAQMQFGSNLAALLPKAFFGIKGGKLLREVNKHLFTVTSAIARSLHTVSNQLQLLKPCEWVCCEENEFTATFMAYKQNKLT
jgi:hypothetical protein